jgi:hypothetical protein
MSLIYVFPEVFPVLPFFVPRFFLYPGRAAMSTTPSGWYTTIPCAAAPFDGVSVTEIDRSTAFHVSFRSIALEVFPFLPSFVLQSFFSSWMSR